jgi:hypothetical protein
MGIETPATGGETTIKASQSRSPGFGNPFVPSTSDPTLTLIQSGAVTDGSTTGQTGVTVTPPGSQSNTYQITGAIAAAALGSNAGTISTAVVPGQAGVEIEITNPSDPVGANAIQAVRVYPLG